MPPLLWKNEILIIVNSNVSNNSSIFNNSLYGFANVNIISMSGSWALSENYLEPRLFNRLNRYGEVQRNGNINLQGRELQISSIYRPPMTYLNHTVATAVNGVPAEVFLMDDVMDWDGIEMRLFLIIAEKLNFSWIIRKPDGNDTYGRRINETFWKGGIIQMLNDKKIHVAFASIWVTLDQTTFVHLTEPWYEVGIHFLVPRPRRTTSFWALTKPFPNEIWFLLVTVLLLYSSYTYVRAWIDPDFPKRFRNFLITLIDLIGLLLSSSVPRIVSTNKLQVLLWRTAGWLIITAYCSSLASRLATSEYESRVDTVEQFLKANLSWGAKETEPFGDYFDLTNPNAAQLPSKYHFIENDAQLERLIAEGNYAIPGQIIDKYFYPSGSVPNEYLKKYRLMKEPLSHFPVAFAVQPWLLNHVNRIILWLKETGITLLHIRDVTRGRDSSNLREVFIEHDGYDGSVQVLSLMPLGAGFSLLLVGSSIAIFVFYLELKRAAGQTSIRELLRKIDRKREFQYESGVHYIKDSAKQSFPITI